MEQIKINNLIAEKVMGWDIVKEEYNVVYKFDGGLPIVFDPTDDMNDAWEVVNKLRQEEQCHFILRNGDLKEYECVFKQYSSEKEYIAESDYPEMAICLAALRLRGVEV